MNEVLQNILTRRSCRAFTEQKISREDLTLLVDAARHAPSGMNKQLWHFTVIQNPDKIALLAAAVGAATGNSAYDFYRPNALLLASNERSNPHGVEDCACALENVFLAAHALGIGSVWINQLRHVCDTPEVRKLLDAYGVPEDHAVYGVAALGYPASAPGIAVKKEDVVSWVL